jgi:hypothetical protein
VRERLTRDSGTRIGGGSGSSCSTRSTRWSVPRRPSGAWPEPWARLLERRWPADLSVALTFGQITPRQPIHIQYADEAQRAGLVGLTAADVRRGFKTCASSDSLAASVFWPVAAFHLWQPRDVQVSNGVADIV